MKLLIRIRERIEIVYITIVFISVLVSFVITAILAHVNWTLAQEWALSSQNSYMGIYLGMGACLGHYGMGKKSFPFPTRLSQG